MSDHDLLQILIAQHAALRDDVREMRAENREEHREMLHDIVTMRDEQGARIRDNSHAIALCQAELRGGERPMLRRWIPIPVWAAIVGASIGLLGVGATILWG